MGLHKWVINKEGLSEVAWTYEILHYLVIVTATGSLSGLGVVMLATGSLVDWWWSFSDSD